MNESSVLANTAWQYFSKLYLKWVDAKTTDVKADLIKYGYKVRQTPPKEHDLT